MIKYQCKKIVEAEKIHSIHLFEVGAIVWFASEANITVTTEWLAHTGAKPGGYFVKSAGAAEGHTYSSAPSFESDYTKVGSLPGA